MRAVLWGVDHNQLGRTVTSCTGSAAVALSRGAFAKTYAYVDPNEDAVAAVEGPRATLLVAADGHRGATASMCVVKFVLDRFGADPPPALDDRGWVDLFVDANDAVVEATAGDSLQPASRTVLLLALVTAGNVSFGSMGDAALVVARPGSERGRQLNQEAARYVGYASTRRGIESSISCGETGLAPDEWVVLATDGLSEFISPMRPADLVPRILARAGGDPEEAAGLLVEAAGRAGAGDNVGIALTAPKGV